MKGIRKIFESIKKSFRFSPEEYERRIEKDIEEIKQHLIKEAEEEGSKIEIKVRRVDSWLSSLNDDELIDEFLCFKANVDEYGPYVASGYDMYVALGREIERRLEKKELKKALSGD